MGDSRKADYDKYEMAPTTDPEKGGGDNMQQEEAEWTGLGKEELLKVANTPGWNWARNILLILFWVAWIAMLIAAIVIVVRVPRCPEVEWWEKSAMYQVFPRSFRDSDGDGVGDLKGLTQNLDYLETLGVKVLYLTSIYEQPEMTTDIGYDIVNFTNVDPQLGNLTHFDELVSALQEKEIKLILEFVPNHSSDKHPWFVDSMKSKDSMYSDFYVWANGTGTAGDQPPNDMLNAYGEPAWTLSADRGQFYFHRFLSSQPDLNYNNESLNAAVMKAMKFWLDRKVDGFVFSNIDSLVDPQLVEVVVAPGAGSRRRRQADNTTTTAPVSTDPMAADPTSVPNNTMTTMAVPKPEPEPTPMSGGEEPVYTGGEGAMANNEKLAMVLKEWRSLLHNESYLGKYRLMVTHSKFDQDSVIMQYGKNDSYLADLPLNSGLVDILSGSLSGTKIMNFISGFLQAKKSAGAGSRWNTWMLGCHDTGRIASRVGKAYTDAMNMLLFTLPGTPFAYYGDELGVENLKLASFDDVVDPVARKFEDKWEELTRDPERAPLPWDNSTHGNFTKGNSTWLPLPDNIQEVNIKTLMAKPMSTLNQFSVLSEYHGKPSIVAGDFVEVVKTDSVISYTRSFPDWPFYLVAMNVGTEEVTQSFHSPAPDRVPAEGKVILSTTGTKKDMLSMENVKLKPGEAVLVEFRA